MYTSSKGAIHSVTARAYHYIRQSSHFGEHLLVLSEFMHTCWQPVLNVGGAYHDGVHFKSKSNGVHIARIKPAEVLLLFESTNHSVHPSIILPSLLIIEAHFFGTREIVRALRGVATSTSGNELTIRTNRTLAGFESL